jgi:hypothetical protein
MPKPGLAYEKPSRVSQVLVIGFSLAVIVMAGWLVMMIMLSHDANTMAADPADPQVTAASPRVGTAAPEPIRLSAVTQPPPQPTPPSGLPTPWPFTPYSGGAAPPPPPAPATAARQVAPPRVDVPATPAAEAPVYTTSSVPAGAPEINDRVPLEDTLPQAETPDATEIIPLPPPKPRRMAAVPVPRPRPHLDSDDAPPQVQERSFFDFLTDRQR